MNWALLSLTCTTQEPIFTYLHRFHIFVCAKKTLRWTKLRKGNVFTPVCQSFCSQGGVCPSACWDTPLPWADTPPGRHPPANDPNGRWLLLRTVRILLECILVISNSEVIYSTFSAAQYITTFDQSVEFSYTIQSYFGHGKWPLKRHRRSP